MSSKGIGESSTVNLRPRERAERFLTPSLKRKAKNTIFKASLQRESEKEKES